MSSPPSYFILPGSGTVQDPFIVTEDALGTWYNPIVIQDDQVRMSTGGKDPNSTWGIY